MKYIPKPGDYVQIWDNNSPTINGHGRLGYVVKKWSDTPDGEGPVYQVICFSTGHPEWFNVWHGWLNKIMNSTDIKER